MKKGNGIGHFTEIKKEIHQDEEEILLTKASFSPGSTPSKSNKYLSPEANNLAGTGTSNEFSLSIIRPSTPSRNRNINKNNIIANNTNNSNELVEKIVDSEKQIIELKRQLGEFDKENNSLKIKIRKIIENNEKKNREYDSTIDVLEQSVVESEGLSSNLISEFRKEKVKRKKLNTNFKNSELEKELIIKNNEAIKNSFKEFIKKLAFFLELKLDWSQGDTSLFFNLKILDRKLDEKIKNSNELDGIIEEYEFDSNNDTDDTLTSLPLKKNNFLLEKSKNNREDWKKKEDLEIKLEELRSNLVDFEIRELESKSEVEKLKSENFDLKTNVKDLEDSLEKYKKNVIDFFYKIAKEISILILFLKKNDEEKKFYESFDSFNKTNLIDFDSDDEKEIKEAIEDEFLNAFDYKSDIILAQFCDLKNYLEKIFQFRYEVNEEFKLKNETFRLELMNSNDSIVNLTKEKEKLEEVKKQLENEIEKKNKLINDIKIEENSIIVGLKKKLDEIEEKIKIDLSTSDKLLEDFKIKFNFLEIDNQKFELINKELKNDLLIIEDDKKSLKGELDNLNQVIENYKNNLETSTKNFNSLKMVNETQKEKILSLNSRIEELEKKEKILQSLQSDYNKLSEQNEDEKNRLINEILKLKAEKEETINNLSSEKITLKNDLDLKLSGLKISFSEKEEKIKGLEDNLFEKEEFLSDYEAKYFSLLENKKEIEEEKSNLNYELSQSENKIAQLKLSLQWKNIFFFSFLFVTILAFLFNKLFSKSKKENSNY